MNKLVLAVPNSSPESLEKENKQLKLKLLLLKRVDSAEQNFRLVARHHELLTKELRDLNEEEESLKAAMERLLDAAGYRPL